MILISTLEDIVFFFFDVKLWVVITLDSKLVVCLVIVQFAFFDTVHSPTCTTYRKRLQECIMSVLTPKSGIVFQIMERASRTPTSNTYCLV